MGLMGTTLGEETFGSRPPAKRVFAACMPALGSAVAPRLLRLREGLPLAST